MSSSHRQILIVLTLVSLPLFSGVAEDWSPPRKPLSGYQETLLVNPFGEESADEASREPNFARHFQVAAISRIGSADTVLVFDQESRNYFTLGEVPNAKNIKLVSIQYHPDWRKSRVTISQSGKLAEVRFSARPRTGRTVSTTGFSPPTKDEEMKSEEEALPEAETGTPNDVPRRLKLRIPNRQEAEELSTKP
ncbi:MAG: hypothetical protein AAF191_08885 [Verrucomicrobiota bacterium]